MSEKRSDNKRIELRVAGVTYNQSSSSAYAVILETVKTKIKIPIIIGPLDANAISIKLENIKTVRPLTHDLLINFTQAFGITIKEVLINNFSKGVFYAKLICIDRDGIIQIIDSRTSDAIALALRANVPIYTYAKIVEITGISNLDENIEDETDSEKQYLEKMITRKDIAANDLSKFSLNELKEMINIAVDREEYEKASVIQKYIKSISKENE